MEKIDRKEKAYALFKSGRNCAQSVLLAFDDILDVDTDTLANMSIAFGGGFGRTRNLCGAVSAMGMVLGLYEKRNGDIAADKLEIYKEVQNLVGQFRERNTTENCAELLKNVKNITNGYVPQVRDDEYYRTRPCVKFVLDSVDILEKYLQV
ncbi:MAG: C-GCAxxG-C-C family protein [Clostridia bacterium]